MRNRFFNWICFIFVTTIGSATALEPVRQTILPTEPLTPGQTTIWSPALQKSWDGLCEVFQVDSIDLKPENKYAEHFNGFKWESDKSLPPHGLVTIAGVSGPQFVATVNSALGQHFGNSVAPLDTSTWPRLPETGVAILTYFRRSVQFDANFGPQKDEPFTFYGGNGKPTQVDAFGSWNGLQRKTNVGCGRVLAYTRGKKLALALKTADPEEFVLLLMDPEQKSIDAAIEEGRNLLNAKQPYSPDAFITNLDSIWIPNLKLSHAGKFEGVLPGFFSVPAAPQIEWKFERAVQNIDVSLTHSGADMHVRAFLVLPGFLSSGTGQPAEKPKPPVPREFKFNRPFFLMFWRKNGTVPYLACHIDTGGLIPRSK